MNICLFLGLPTDENLVHGFKHFHFPQYFTSSRLVVYFFVGVVQPPTSNWQWFVRRQETPATGCRFGREERTGWRITKDTMGIGWIQASKNCRDVSAWYCCWDEGPPVSEPKVHLGWITSVKFQTQKLHRSCLRFAMNTTKRTQPPKLSGLFGLSNSWYWRLSCGYPFGLETYSF